MFYLVQVGGEQLLKNTELLSIILETPCHNFIKRSVVDVVSGENRLSLGVVPSPMPKPLLYWLSSRQVAKNGSRAPKLTY